MMGNKSFGVVALLVLMSGCTPNDQNMTRAQGAGVGAAVGAGLGAIIGGDTEDALIGAAVGGLAGLAVGEVVARKKAKYASTEAMIREERASIQKKTREMASYNNGLRAEFDRLNQEIAALEAEVAAQRTDHGAALDLRSRAEGNLAAARRRLAEVNQEVDVSRQLYDQAKSEGASTDLASWNKQIFELERLRDELVVLIGDFETDNHWIS